MRRRFSAAGLFLVWKTMLGLAAAVFLVQGLWIPAKAELAQILLERSWKARQEGMENAAPWPWADTRAIAKLHVPRLESRHLVLDSPSGRSLAFGPVLLTAAGSDPVLFGHRDTHFRFLKDLQHGDELLLESLQSERSYRVTQIDIIDSREQIITTSPMADRLTLVTCYPFNALEPNGPLRYVVTALPAGEG